MGKYIKTYNVSELFSEQQISRAQKFYPDITKIREQIVEPAIEHINRITGQENDTRYLSYVLVYAIIESKKNKK